MYWLQYCIAGRLVGPPVTPKALLSALSEWEIPESHKDVRLPANGQLLLPTADGRSELRFRVFLGKELPSADAWLTASAYANSFSEFVGLRLGMERANRRRGRWDSLPFSVSGTPSEEPGEFVSAYAIQDVCAPFRQLNVEELHRAVKVYREPEGSLVALNTWLLDGKLERDAAPTLLQDIRSPLAEVCGWRAVAIDRRDTENIDYEEGCCWAERKLAK